MAKLAENKTKQTEASVADFINNITDEQKRKDSEVILKMMQKATKEKPKIWGNSMIGFGYVIIKSPSGREVEWFKMGFAPRKANLSLYLNIDIKSKADMLKKLGKHKTGVGCLYINKLADVDVKVLEEMINGSQKNKDSKKDN
jgi:hypothetical protein